ncbi:MAG: c-type cytochrome domain-containing protein, partial [Haliscomenobacter sp.]
MYKKPILYILGILLPGLGGFLLWRASGSVQADTATLDYNIHIRPILSDKCFACHGPDARAREAGLRLDRAESA